MSGRGKGEEQLRPLLTSELRRPIVPGVKPCDGEAMNSATPAGSLAPIIDMESGISITTVNPLAGLKVTDRAAREEILHRAYAIWESEGQPQDRKLANWLEAEAEVLRDITDGRVLEEMLVLAQASSPHNSTM